MPFVLSSNWWALALRGVAGLIFGLLAFAVPGVTMSVLVWWFGAYALVDGIFALIAAFRGPEGNRRWGALLFEGIAGIVAGIFAFGWTVMTAAVLMYLIAFWAIITGVFEIGAAIRLRRAISGEWALMLMGVLSIVFGILILFAPLMGALVVTLWIGAYALVFGILMLILAFRVRRLLHHGGVPGPAYGRV